MRKSIVMSEISLDGMAAISSKKFMTQPLSDSFASPTFNQFIAPLYELQQAAKNQYHSQPALENRSIFEGQFQINEALKAGRWSDGSPSGFLKPGR